MEGLLRSWEYYKHKMWQRNKMPFLEGLVLLTGFWDLKDILYLRQIRSKNKLVSENAVTQGHGSCFVKRSIKNEKIFLFRKKFFHFIYHRYDS